MNDELVGNEPNLEVYYDYNQGTPGGNNTSISQVLDRTSNGIHADLINFGLTGTLGNFVAEKVERGSVQFTGTAVDGPCGLYPIGTTTITVSTADLIGNTTSCTYDVTINDSEAPVPDLATLPAITGGCQVTTLTAPTATDCTAGTVTGTTTASLPITSNTTITWTYDDGLGHTSTQNQSIIINTTPADLVRDDALNFDGVDNHVQFPVGMLQTVTDFTFECWFIKDRTGNGWERLMDFGSDSSVNMFLTSSIGNSGILRFAITTGGSGNEQRLTAPFVLSANQWYHAAVTIDATNDVGILYVNGIEVARNNNMTLTPSNLGNTIQNWLGRSQYAADNFLDARMDEVRFWSTARTATEIREHMHLTLEGCETDLLSYYQFNDGVGATTLNDVTGTNNGTLVNTNPAMDCVPSSVNVGNDATMASYS